MKNTDKPNKHVCILLSFCYASASHSPHGFILRYSATPFFPATHRNQSKKFNFLYSHRGG